MKQHIQRLLRQKWAVPAATGVVGFGLGAIVGYWRTKSQYDQIQAQLDQLSSDTDGVKENPAQYELDFEDAVAIEAARRLQVLQRHPSQGVYEGPATDLEDKRPGSGGKRVTVDLSPLEEAEEKGKAVVTNIFSRGKDDDAGDEWDYKTELETRDKSQPYIIHVDEYVNDEMGWDNQSTLTWYEKDQILCDSKDVPIFNHSEVVGDLRFGHGTNDVNAVYIRNERLQAEYEVIRDAGSYEEIVLGASEEQSHIKHSDRVFKLRDFD